MSVISSLFKYASHLTLYTTPTPAPLHTMGNIKYKGGNLALGEGDYTKCCVVEGSLCRPKLRCHCGAWSKSPPSTSYYRPTPLHPSVCRGPQITHSRNLPMGTWVFGLCKGDCLKRLKLIIVMIATPVPMQRHKGIALGVGLCQAFSKRSNPKP